MERVQRLPKRLRRSRKKGYRTPARAIYVGRPTKFGNPWSIGCYTDATPANVVEWYRRALVAGTLKISVEDVRRELRGADLVCWCPLDQPCHADVLLELANT